MNWHAVRLELARTPSHLNGSAVRSYLLRLPIGNDGTVDRAEIARHPTRATVRRCWPNEADRTGSIAAASDALTFAFGRFGLATLALPANILQADDVHMLSCEESDEVPLRIVSISPLA